MNAKRLFVYAGFFMCAMLLWQTWQQEHFTEDRQKTSEVSIPVDEGIPSDHSKLVLPDDQGQPSADLHVSERQKDHGHVSVETDTLKVNINLLGGNVSRVALKNYTLSLENQALEKVLDDTQNAVRASQSGLEGEQGPDNAKTGQAIYQADKASYALSDDQNQLRVDLHWHNAKGVKVTKHLIFKRNSYVIEQSYSIDNGSTKKWQAREYAQLKTRKQEGNGMFGMRTYAGNAISSPDKKYEKLPFDDLAEKNLDRKVTGGWLAAQEHYFIAAWVPEAKSEYHYYSFVSHNDTYTVGMVGQRFSVNPGNTITTSPSVLYAGPEEATRLDKVAPGSLKLTIDYGHLWVISAPIFWGLQKIHQALGNWGWAIVFITLFIKLLFYRMSASSYRSMAKMRVLQPKLMALKDRCGDDKQKLSQETMALYKKEGANPLGGCFPMLVQIPIFLALYWVLIESVELRQAPFVFWLHDLSVKDPYYVLPLLMGVSMFVQQQLNPKPQDPMQAKVMMFLPVMMTGLFLSFPAGLVLYWLTNNVLSIAQQWSIMRRFGSKKA